MHHSTLAFFKHWSKCETADIRFWIRRCLSTSIGPMEGTPSPCWSPSTFELRICYQCALWTSTNLSHKNKCDLFCDVNAITRCIESRIIDGEFFPHTLSAVDTMLLNLLREIVDVKYLQTPPFTSLNSPIQSWSADYRLGIARSRTNVQTWSSW